MKKLFVSCFLFVNVAFAQVNLNEFYQVKSESKFITHLVAGNNTFTKTEFYLVHRHDNNLESFNHSEQFKFLNLDYYENKLNYFQFINPTLDKQTNFFKILTDLINRAAKEYKPRYAALYVPLWGKIVINNHLQKIRVVLHYNYARCFTKHKAILVLKVTDEGLKYSIYFA